MEYLVGILLLVLGAVLYMMYSLRNIVEDKSKLVETLSNTILEKETYIAKVLSQKKSSEVRLGQITEHIVPFLVGFRHDPKDCHFLGQPIDMIAFDFDQGEITFIEVKSGNARESARQKQVKNIIKEGKVYYESIRVNEKGVVSKREDNK